MLTPLRKSAMMPLRKKTDHIALNLEKTMLKRTAQFILAIMIALFVVALLPRFITMVAPLLTGCLSIALYRFGWFRLART